MTKLEQALKALEGIIKPDGVGNAWAVVDCMCPADITCPIMTMSDAELTKERNQGVCEECWNEEVTQNDTGTTERD